jgi:hypothetical protein
VSPPPQGLLRPAPLVPSAITVPPHLQPVVIPSALDTVPAYVLVEARFQRLVPVGDGGRSTLFLEFRPTVPAGDDARWHTLWFRPCEPDQVVAGFVEASLSEDERVQIAVPVNPPEPMRGELATHCQAAGYRTPAEADDYADSVFATNLQTLRGEDAGIYLGGSLTSLVRVSRHRPEPGGARAESPGGLLVLRPSP